MSRWRLALALTFAAALLAAAGVGYVNRDEILGTLADPQAQAKPDPLDVVFVADISSPARRVGEDLTQGFKDALAASPFADAVRVLVRDDQGRTEALEALAEGATSGFRTLAVIGPSQPKGFPVFAGAMEQGEVPALVPVAPPQETDGGRWMFNMQPSQRQQGLFAGRLIHRIQPAKRVAFVSLKDSSLDGYWSGIAESFGDTSIESIASHQIEADVDADAMQMQTVGLLGFDLIFIDLPSEKAALVLRTLRDKGYRGKIVGLNEMALADFPQRFKDFPAERLAPGHYTNGVFAVAPFSPDVSGEISRQLTETYHAKAGTDPSWAYAYGYDAGALLVNFMAAQREAGHDPLDANPEQWRAALREYLEVSRVATKPTSAFTGALVFNEQHQRDLAPSLLEYREGRLSPYPLQFSDRPGRLEVNEAAVAENSVQVGDRYYDLVPVVFTGIRFHSISEVSLEKSEFSAEFDLWFRSSVPIAPEDIVFPSGRGEGIEGKVIDSLDDARGFYRRIRYQGRFSFESKAGDLLLERLTLPLVWHHRTLDSSNLRFVVDSASFNSSAVNSSIHDQVMRENVLAPSLGYVAAASVFAVENKPIRGLGDPRARGGQLWFSTMSSNLVLQTKGAAIGPTLARQIPSSLAATVSAACLFLFGLLVLLRRRINQRPLARQVLQITSFSIGLLFAEVWLFGSSLLGDIPGSWLVLLRQGFAFGYYAAAAFLANAAVWWVLRKGVLGQGKSLQGTLGAIITTVIFFSVFAAYYTSVLGRNFLPILATSSVLLTVVGLAMREVILDAIGGITIHMENELAVGHWIRVQTKETSYFGVVTFLGWRTITIRTRDDQMHAIPNSMVFQYVLTNFSARGGYTRIWIPFEVNTRADLSHVIDELGSAVSAAVARLEDVDTSRPIRVICQEIESDSAEMAVQVFYKAASSPDELKTVVLSAVNEVLIRENALPSTRIDINRTINLAAEVAPTVETPDVWRAQSNMKGSVA
jgi:branched-chain amino acid transport system substrate-binding protein